MSLAGEEWRRDNGWGRTRGCVVKAEVVVMVMEARRAFLVIGMIVCFD